MTPEALWLLLACGALLWFWTDSMGAREVALIGARRACRQADAQLLDATVALAGVGLARDRGGRVRLRRRYRFEFSLSGDSRYPGEATLLGRRVQLLVLEHPEGRLIL